MTHHIEILVEELSMERVLNQLVPQIVPSISFAVRTFNGKPDLLRKLPARLAGYRPWIQSAQTCLLVIVDRDQDDCRELKRQLDGLASSAGLQCASVESDREGDIINRVAVEELEAWFFGDIPAMRAAYPRLPESLGSRSSYRHPDEIRGGTAEALARVLKAAGYHEGGLQKTSAAQDIAQHMNIADNRSPSFQHLREALRHLAGVN